MCLSHYVRSVKQSLCSPVSPQDLPTAGHGSDNTARRILDGMGSVAGAVGSISAMPTKMVCGCVADKVAHGYWVPNSRITVSSCILEGVDVIKWGVNVYRIAGYFHRVQIFACFFYE